MQPTPRDAIRRALTVAGVTGAAVTLSAVAAMPALAGHGQGGAGQDPPGNNGTVFIHRSAGDSHPGNQPHVSCSFYVSLFGFDAGQQLTASFAGQAPTGKGVALPVTDGTATTATSPDAAGGAGHDYDGDLGPFTVSNLDVANKLGAPAKQGWHITLTVDTGQGGGHKHKVFWLAPCAAPAAAPAATAVAGPSAPGPTTPGPVSGPVSGPATGAAVGGADVEGTRLAAAPTTGGTSGSAGAGAQVLGERFSRPAPAGAHVLGESMTRSAQAAALPFTGAEIGVMAAAGVAAIGGGAGLLLAARRRRRAALAG